MLWRKIFLGLLIILILVSGGFIVWAETPPEPMAEAIQALNSTKNVKVDQTKYLIFTPSQKNVVTGLIFYPGGRIEASSYAPLAERIASRGYLVVIVPMSLNLAVFSPNKGLEVIKAFPEISNWAIGGHSLGGTMAASLVAQNPDKFRGLVLWAAYPVEGVDLSVTNLHVSVLYGTQDGLVAEEVVLATKDRLPGNTLFQAIEGGNHSQFGWYGAQSGDQAATISREEQQRQIVDSTVELLVRISELR